MAKKTKLMVGGQEVIFETKRHANVLKRVIEAAQLKQRVSILYAKSDGMTKWRSVAPYSVRNVMTPNEIVLYAEEDGRIKSFALDGIREAKLTGESYIPQWPVEL